MNWYAIWVMSRAEFIVRARLDLLGIESFLPTYDEKVEWSDRRKITTRPLFPGYIFARFDPFEPREMSNVAYRDEVMKSAGVVDILPSSMNPQPVDPSQLEIVHRVIRAGLDAEPCQYISGDEVEIETGPLSGIRGIVQRTKTGHRLIVRIEMLHRAISVELDACDVRKHQTKTLGAH